MMKLLIWTFSLVLLVSFACAEIHDPLNIFCGSANCYDILGVQKTDDIKTIKKAFRKLSLTQHPDKNKAENATEVFRAVSKAFQVLTGNESRPLFDYYLSHPRDYFKVSGQHYYRNMPKSDVRIITVAVLLLASWFFHTIQNQKYMKAVKFLKHAVSNNLGLKSGGTKQTIALYNHAAELYEERIKQLKAEGDKTAGKGMKMLKDPLFLTFVDQVVDAVKIEGGYRKPEWNDLVIVQCVLFPQTLYIWAKTYHRRYISNEPLSMDDQIEMARERVGLATWEEMSEQEQDKLIEQKIWLSAVYNAWIAEREKQYIAATASEELKRKKKYASKKKSNYRSGGVSSGLDEDDSIDE